MPSASKLAILLAAGLTLTAASPVTRRSSHYTSPDVYPSPETYGFGGWEDALAKAETFVSQLTLEEKLLMITGVPGPCAGNIAPVHNLSFPGLCLQDGPLAIRQTDYASVFPAGVSAGATWDEELIYKRAFQMGSEFRAKGSQIALGPVAGPLGRAALMGRNWEGFSNDPYLAGKAFALTIQGIQDTGVQAVGKHFIAYEQETNRLGDSENLAISSNLDDRTMHEAYLWPFADAVRAGVASIMCSYNRVNQTTACGNSKTLNGLLKGELGFQGYVMSDWLATHYGYQDINAGLDMDQPGSWGGFDELFGDYLKPAINNGSLTIERVEDMIKRIMTPYYFLGQDSGFPNVDPGMVDLNGMGHEGMEEYNFDLTGTAHRDVREDHRKLIRQMGAESSVLLKNVNNALPLSQPKNVGVFGNGAADAAWGLYPADVMSISGDTAGLQATGGGSGMGRLTTLISPLEAIKHRVYNYGGVVQYITNNTVVADGIDTVYPSPDVCIVFVTAWASEGYDRTSYVHTNNGSEAVLGVANNCNNTIVVTYTPGPAEMSSWADHDNVTAIVAAHMPGEEIGNAIVDILYGETNPSGHLPYTILEKESDYPDLIVNISSDNTDINAWQSDFTDGLYIDYRYYDKYNTSVRYPFGYGLSYTNFTLADITAATVATDITAYPANATTVPGGNPHLWDVLVSVNATLQNTGSVSGATVAQLYLFPASSSPEGTPIKTLRGFNKQFLAAGDKHTISFDLTRRDLSYWDVVAQDWKIPSGSMTVKIGLNAGELPLEATFSLL